MGGMFRRQPRFASLGVVRNLLFRRLPGLCEHSFRRWFLGMGGWFMRVRNRRANRCLNSVCEYLTRRPT